MSAKRDKFVKGRRGPISEGLLNRHNKSHSKTGVRKRRKQRDIKISGTKRHAIRPRRRRP